MQTLTHTSPSILSSWQALATNDLTAHVAHHGPMPIVDDRFAELLLRAVGSVSLAGRGGGGFPAARKLAAHRRLRRAGTLVVNAMEGEPASAKDHALLSCVPHLLLDGAEVAAAVAGCDEIVVCVPDDRDEMAAPLMVAIGERRTSRRTRAPIAVARPPGRYVAGEESALVAWLERGMSAPTFRLDKAVPLQLSRSPVLVHNAETIAHLALIAREVAANGATGQVAVRRTTLVTVSGAVDRPGVYEIPLGMRVSDVIGLAAPAAPVRAALIGGFGGRWIGPEALHTPFDMDSLREVGAAPGAGVIVALPEDACGLAETARIASYMARESAGQCGPCVFGLPAIADDVATLARGSYDRHLLRRLWARLSLVAGRGACRHPDGVAAMVASALEVFGADVARHAKGDPCSHRGRTPLVQVATR